jgi:hypothetical protein
MVSSSHWLVGTQASYRRNRWKFAGKGQIFHAAMCLAQNPHPATVVHALKVKFQEEGGD